VARPHAMTSYWVAKEVQACLTAKRAAIVIDVNGSFRAREESEIYSRLADRIAIRDDIQELDSDPSPRVLKELRAGFLHTRQEVKRLQGVSAAAVVLAILAVASLWLYLAAEQARQIAEERRKTALARQLAAQSQLMLAENPQKWELGVLLGIESFSRQSTVES